MKKLLQILAILPVWFLSATIVEVSSFEQIQIPDEKNLLVILDIDNTLMHPKQDLGSDQWYYYRRKELQNQGLTMEQASRKVNFEFNGIQTLSLSKIVEDPILVFLEGLRKKKIPYIGLTARSFELALRTHQQLHDCGIIFESKFFDPQPHFLDKGSLLFCYGGVVFTNGGNKGQAFDLWKKHVNLTFDHVIVIDDKKAHLESLQKTIVELGGKFTGYRYGFLDEHVRNFCPKKAKEQFHLIEPLIEGKLP
jgi:hypothetical protein